MLNSNSISHPTNKINTSIYEVGQGLGQRYVLKPHVKGVVSVAHFELTFSDWGWGWLRGWPGTSGRG